MILVGNPELFAIESRITDAYESRAFLALGCFILHVGGKRYGVDRPDASLLACSFDEVTRRIANRGKHFASFMHHKCAGDIADAVFGTMYGSRRPDHLRLGLSESEIRNVVQSNRILWAPDGDQAFDDGSYVLQLDDGNNVRLIGFRVGEDERHLRETLSDVLIPEASFYGLLQEWRDDFESSWLAAPKAKQ